MPGLAQLPHLWQNALKIILKDEYISYDHALTKAGLESLVERRDKLCLKFAKACLKNDNVKDMFPINDTINQDVRDRDKFKVTFAHKGRLKDSAIPYMQRLLNANQWWLYLKKNFWYACLPITKGRKRLNKLIVYSESL